MALIHIYGDSYAHDHGEPWQWFRQLSNTIKQPYRITACEGIPNDWISHHVLEDEWQPGDIPIIIATEPARQWWFEKDPHMSNVASIFDTDEFRNYSKANKRQVDSVHVYYAHLWRPELDMVRFHAHVALWCTRGVAPVVIPAFDTPVDYTHAKCTVQGSLDDCVSKPEFASERAMLAAYSRDGRDTRINHMNRHNHTVLADKIAHGLLTGTIDLTQGFQKAKPTL